MRPKGSKNKVAKLVGEPYKVQLKSLGRIFRSEGATLEEALGKIKISGGVRVMSVLTIEKDGVKKDKLLRGDHAARLFTPMGPTNREIALKWVHQSFGL